MNIKWPIVTKNDDGIRPAGAPDECFYCRQKVGQNHKEDCVTIKKHLLLQMKIPYQKTILTVLFEAYIPFNWTESDILFRYNEGTWCTSNAFDKHYNPKIFLDKEPVSIEEILDRLSLDPDHNLCFCAQSQVEIVKILSNEPNQYPGY